VAALGFAADSVDGRWNAARSGWGQSLSFTGERVFEGNFRILWIGDPAVLPTDPFEVRDGVAYALTVDDAGDARELLRAPRQDADAVVVDAVSLALDGRTNRLGRLVAPMGVRYVAAPVRNGPGGPHGTKIAGLDARLADQLDLAQLGVESGLVLYENTAWFPGRGVASDDAEVPTGKRAPIPAALRSDLSGDVTPLGDAPAGPGQIVDAQAYDDAWQATVDGRTLRHEVGFGWANTWALPAKGEVALHYTDQRTTTLLIAGQVLLWLAIVVVGWTGRRRRLMTDSGPALSRSERREQADRRRETRAAARDRRRRDVLDDDFWGDA